MSSLVWVVGEEVCPRSGSAFVLPMPQRLKRTLQPVEAFGQYLTNRGAEDPRVEALFAELLDDEADAAPAEQPRGDHNRFELRS